MNWWGWMVVGAILLGSELSFVNAQFYLVLVGAAAIATGLLSLIYPTLPEWSQWAAFALLAIVLMVGVRSRLYGWLHLDSPPMQSGPTGQTFTLAGELAPGASCQAEQGGSFWTVRNISDTTIAAGARVRIAQIQGLTLLVQPEPSPTGIHA